MLGSRRDSGFSLIEVLVALTIVGFALAAVAGVFSNGVSAHETVSDAETALALAEERLALASAAPRPGASGGSYAERFTWKTTVAIYDNDKARPAGATSSLPVLYRIAVDVAWRDGRRSREVALSTLRLGTPP